jgi:YidC/Oxa1 family membrane protein insertase
MTDMRRALLWGVFTVSLFLLWDGWNKHNGQPSLFGGPRPAVTTTAVPGAASAAVGVPTAVATPATPGAPVAAPVAPGIAATPTGQEVVITTDVVRATFDTIGGNLVRLELLNQIDAEDRSRHVVLFDRSRERVYAAQTGLITAQPGVTLPNHWTEMRYVPGATTLAPGMDSIAIRFEATTPGGVSLAKTFILKRGEYTLTVHHDVTNGGTTPVSPQLYLQLTRDGNPARGESRWYFTFTGPAIYTEAKKYEKVDFKDIEKGKASHATQANDGWAAMVQHYYAAAWLVPGTGAREFRTQKVGDNLYAVQMVLPLGEVGPGATKSHDATLFAGPQEENKLAAMAPGLELVKDYGWLRVLAKPLFWVLDNLFKGIGNWGWSIIALVVLLKIAFYWLNASAYRSMAKMKALTPRLTDMRERYKDKPQLMQQEMMRIYREEKVNPLGGCLPIVVQMPFFIALYWVLLSSVEMRNAPWVAWIHDLSTPDPWFVLPLLMLASSLLQVWLQPSPADPMQAKMMWIMPIMFGVMFFFFPAGLVLYWLTNNLLSIAQQWWINRRLGVS